MDVDHNKRKYRYVQQSFKEDLYPEQHTEEKDSKMTKEVKKIVQRVNNVRPRPVQTNHIDDLLPIFKVLT